MLGALMIVLAFLAGARSNEITKTSRPVAPPRPGAPATRRRVGREAVGDVNLPHSQRVDDVLLGVDSVDINGDGTASRSDLLERPRQELPVDQQPAAAAVGVVFAS